MDQSKYLSNFFLSASIPSPERDERFYETADIIAIREAIKALSMIVIPKVNLVWGGHPSITPLIRYILAQMNVEIKKHVTLYQSLYYEEKFPIENTYFEHIVFTPKSMTLKDSIRNMRISMIKDNDFKAGVFIGGMEGVLEEYELFKQFHPTVKVFPIASTGGASKILYQKLNPRLDTRLISDYAYVPLFRDLFANIL